MQMYEVSFQTHYEDLIDIGKVIVCAQDQDNAAQIVAFILGIPASQTVFNVVRIKPSLYQIDRREVVKHALQDSHNMRHSPDYLRFNISVVSGIRAASESHAFRKLGQALISRSSSEKAVVDKSITELEMSCECSQLKPRVAALERQAIYSKPQFFSGGAARPR